MLRSLVASLLVLSCSPAEPRAREPEPAPTIQPPEQPGPEPREPVIEDDLCDPLPKVGDPCPAHASYCVVDWGEPCGASTALWCRNGVWEREQEANECD
ncbi:MAG TPA: hypothetical protein VM869_14370 [Enhygromyxa sp.]|nr:hypothetical protein [Enhygromyxa sp.]